VFQLYDFYDVVLAVLAFYRCRKADKAGVAAPARVRFPGRFVRVATRQIPSAEAATRKVTMVIQWLTEDRVLASNLLHC
jgi:hypothetical protein